MAKINPRINHEQGTAQICNKGWVTIRVRKGKRRIDLSNRSVRHTYIGFQVWVGKGKRHINLSSIHTLAFRRENSPSEICGEAHNEKPANAEDVHNKD
jgi:hypothetical protein